MSIQITMNFTVCSADSSIVARTIMPQFCLALLLSYVLFIVTVVHLSQSRQMASLPQNGFVH